MQKKYFITKKSISCPLDSLIPDEIKNTYTLKLHKEIIKRKDYYNLVADTLGYRDWTEYKVEYETKIVPFLQKNGMRKFATSAEIDILKSEYDISFRNRQVSDRLFFGKELPKAIFTGYSCSIDFTARSIFNKSECSDLLIDMDISIFSAIKNLLGDTFLNFNKNHIDKHVAMLYIDNYGLDNQEQYMESAQKFKEQILKLEKGWIEVIPYNDNLIFLKAEDGVYDFIFRNMRDYKKFSPYGEYIKPEFLPTILNEQYDFERWCYYGFKERVKTVRKIVIEELWEERDEHLSEIAYYENNTLSVYPGISKILQDYYTDKGLYKYDRKKTIKEVEGFQIVEFEDKYLFISDLIRIDEFKQFSKIEYTKKRSSELENLEVMNSEDGSFPVSVTWYDAIAYCKYIENTYNVPARLVTKDEFYHLSDNISNLQNKNITLDKEYKFFYQNQLLSSPPPSMNDFDSVVMQQKKKLEFAQNNGLEFVDSPRFKEWTDDFKDGYAVALSIYNEKNIQNYNMMDMYSTSSTYKYKYIKIGFRVCYEVSKADYVAP